MPRIEKSLLMPSEVIKEHFQILKNKGFLYTKAEKVEDMGKHRFPIRSVYSAPTDRLKPNQITIGPFPIEKEHYFHLKKHFRKEKEFWYVYLAFQKIHYEKIGGAGEDYQFQASDEVIADLVNVMTFFEIEKPFIGENFIWFFPTEECKKFLAKIKEKHFRANDYSWWNVAIDLGSQFIPKTTKDYPERFGRIPSDLIDKWSQYLPHSLLTIIVRLYVESTLGGRIRQFSSLSEVLQIIEDELGSLTLESKEMVDRELLIKELCDFNGLKYPVDSKSTFDYLQNIRIILIVEAGRKAKYALAEKVPEPRKMLKFPPEWEERVEKYIATGSVLFSYLNLDEVLQ